jgi:plastocyanin/cytochrome c553
MENRRNPGMLAVALAVALAVLFALLGVTGVFSGRLGFGLAAVCLVSAVLVYIVYSRGDAISRTGFGALIFILAIGLIMPVLFINQQQSQAGQRGAAIYGQYCSSCHGFQGQGINGPKLNNNPAVNALTDDDLTRIIDGGIAGDPTNPSPTGLIMPAWLDTYGGSLTSIDISYLVSFIRSSDPAYVAKNNLPSVNGFSYVLGTLTSSTQIAMYHQQQQTGSKPTDFVDMTGKKQVAVQIVNNPSGVPSNWGFSPPDIQVSVGTTVTWTNISNQIHTVVTRPGTTPPQSFASSLLATGTGTYSFTFTQAGDYPYECGIHPAMLGWVEVK